MAANLAGKRVLVVEDEFFLADDLAQALGRVGAQVIGPTSEQAEALQLLAAGQVDIAIVDINLHGQSGFQIADELTARAVPFVFATGYDPSAIPVRHAHVPRWEKPFNAATLVASLA